MLVRLHSQATTTPKIRAEIQASKDPAWMVGERYGISEQMVWKWRKRDNVHPSHGLLCKPLPGSGRPWQSRRLQTDAWAGA